MKPAYLIGMALAGAAWVPVSAITIEGSAEPAVIVRPEASTGLEAVFVVPDAAGVRLARNLSGGSGAQWYRFSRLGGAYAEEIPSTTEGNVSYAAIGADDMGYMVVEGGRQTCVWVINYSNHEAELRGLSFAPEQDCERTMLVLEGSAPEMDYYTVNGRRMVLSRDLEVEYNTLVFNEESFSYAPTVAHEMLDYFGSVAAVPAPLCDTRFTVAGDRFLEAWHRPQTAESTGFSATRVEVHTRATQTQREVDNEIKDGDQGDTLGGSGPAEIEFEAAVSDAAVFTEWQISRTPEFDILENTFPELVFTYTFRDNGTTYVRFVANNAAGTCEAVSDTYQVFIGESRLEIPNAFSPNASPGVNDEWKVSYRSLVSYKCSIFNRWGKELFSSTDPAQGWDGKTGGKFVPAGVYFYVIEALGTDGIKYKKSGDINIINYTEPTTNNSGE